MKLKKKRILSPEITNILPPPERVETETSPTIGSKNGPLIETLPKATVDLLPELGSKKDLSPMGGTSSSIEDHSNHAKTNDLEEINSLRDKSLDSDNILETISTEQIKETTSITAKSPTSEVKSGSSIRIKIPLKTEILNSQAKEEESKTVGPGQTKKSAALDSQGVLNAWNAYLKLLEKQENHGLITILENIIPVLGADALVTIAIQNLVHKNIFLEESDSIVLFLRKELQNDFIHFDYVLVEKEQENSVPFTAQDKLRHLAEINPLILTLKNQLGLEIDY